MNYLALLCPFFRNRRLPLSRDQAILLMAAFNEIMLGLDTYVAAGAGAVPGRYTLTKQDMTIYFAAMVLMLVVGVMGLYFHVRADLTAQSHIVIERFLRGAPFMSPLLYANMGIIGILAMLDPQED